MARGQAGFEGRAFIGSEGNGATAAAELINGRDFSVAMSGDEIDTTNRDTAPWKQFIPGLMEWSVDFNLLYDNSDDVADAIETAFHGQTTISIRMIDNGGDGFYGDVIVTAWPKEEPIGDAMARAVTLRGTGAPTLVDVVS